jgi:hypothetical protein
MTWSMIWVPLAVVALASLVGWALARWVSRAVTLVLAVGLALVAAVMVTMTVFRDGGDALTYAVWVSGVILPAAIGIAIGAMLTMRRR